MDVTQVVRLQLNGFPVGCAAFKLFLVLGIYSGIMFEGRKFVV